MIRCWFVDDHRADYPITVLCRLVELPRATFYRWANPTLSDRYLDDAYLANEIVDIHRASRCTYGSPRVWGQLRRSGVRVAEKRVARIMAECGLVGAHSRRKWRRGRTNTAPAGDLIEQDFTADASDHRWVADITEFACIDGKLYLAGILDLHDRGIAGWSMSERARTDLVLDALVMAITRRHPDGEIIHHSDRGSVYTSLRFANHLEDLGLVASFGSTGDAYDNAAMESFWATLKRELAWIHQCQRWSSRAELRAALFDYIEIFYNRSRHQAGLEHRTPSEVYAKTRVA